MNDSPVRTPKQLGAILKGHRKELNLTQAEAGAKVGLVQKAVSQLETDPSPASFARIFKLLSALDLELVVRPRKPAGKTSEW